jgi:hypothetical protein
VIWGSSLGGSAGRAASGREDVGERNGSAPGVTGRIGLPEHRPTGVLVSGGDTDLRSSRAISRGGRCTLPLAFTEHGALMAANVFRSDRTIEMSVCVARDFVRLRSTLASQAEMVRKLEELEERAGTHDRAIQSVGSHPLAHGTGSSSPEDPASRRRSRSRDDFGRPRTGGEWRHARRVRLDPLIAARSA